MHSFARHRHRQASNASAKETKGLVLDRGWRYDLILGFFDTFFFRGQLRELRQRTANLARIQPGEHVLDVGCGTERWRLKWHAAWAEQAASQALTQVPNRSPVPADQRLGATCPSIFRSG